MVWNSLDTEKINWTSIDVVYFITGGDKDEKIRGPVVIWVGVLPDSLQGEDAFISGNKILEILAYFRINDVEVEYRESIYRRSVGPALLHPAFKANTTVDVRSPLTPTLELPISAFDRPNYQGTMALFFTEGGDSDKVLGLTCHHVLFKMDKETNSDYDLKGSGAPRKKVQLLGNRGFEDFLKSIESQVGSYAIGARATTSEIRTLEKKSGGDDNKNDELKEQLKALRAELVKANQTIEDLKKFHKKVKTEWASPRNRVIGHIRYSLPSIMALLPKNLLKTGARLSSTAQSSRRRSRATLLTLVCFDLSLSGCPV
jgi:hypothetical protein